MSSYLFEVLTVVTVKITVFCDVTPCNLIGRNKHFRGPCSILMVEEDRQEIDLNH
jgi:hypothetical protein